MKKINYKKILGLFICLPKSKFTINDLQKLCNLDVKILTPILDKLKDKGLISGVKKFKLK